MDVSLGFWDYLLLGTGLLFIAYFYLTRSQRRFSKTEVPYLRPLPIFGSTWRNLLRLENQMFSYGRAYTNFPEARFSGFYEFLQPVLMIRDPDLIRQMGIKDFDHFTDHKFFIDEELEPLFGNMMFLMKGQKWRNMRATLSPAFTGSKMRNMFKLVSDCGQRMTDYLQMEIQKEGALVVDIKSLFTKYSNDVIATAAFGVEVNSFEVPDNEFYKTGKALTDFTGLDALFKFIGFNLAPALMKALNISFLSTKINNFFRELVHGTMSIREKQGIVRPDMIHLLMQAKQGTLQHDATQQQDAGFATVIESEVGTKQTQKTVWKEEELTAQALIFLVAGFDTTSTLLSFTAYELALNCEVQERLQEEIDAVLEELGGDVPGYERINKMNYLDTVISESLRLWPPVAMLDRVCTKSYDVEDYEGNKYRVKDGESVLFPAYFIHRDEKYYSDPEKFNPERFSDENKHNIKPFTYLPFGIGPRNCIGSRFALMETKAILFRILSAFSFKICSTTQIPMRLSKKDFDLVPEKGIWLEISSRNSESN